MPVNDSIASLATDTIIVTRRAEGTLVKGVYVLAAATTLTIRAVVQPAYNLNRVVGGANLDAHVDNQKVTDVRQLWTTTELLERTPTNDPDILTFQGRDWTVARVERWDLTGSVHFHCVCTRSTNGAS